MTQNERHPLKRRRKKMLTLNKNHEFVHYLPVETYIVLKRAKIGTKNTTQYVLSREHLGYDVKMCLRKVFFRDYLSKHVLFTSFKSIFRTDIGK